MNDVQIQGVIGLSVVVTSQTCVELFGEEDGEKREGEESWVSHWLEAGETQKELIVKQEESGWNKRGVFLQPSEGIPEAKSDQLCEIIQTD